MNAKAFQIAVSMQEPKLLQWLHLRGCPWDYWVAREAYLYQQFEVLEWLVKQGCPFRLSPLQVSKCGGKFELEPEDWVREHLPAYL